MLTFKLTKKKRTASQKKSVSAPSAATSALNMLSMMGGLRRLSSGGSGENTKAQTLTALTFISALTRPGIPTDLGLTSKEKDERPNR